MLARAWDALEAGARSAEAPARLVTLASVAREGGAAARLVALRHADRGSARLEVQTDLATEKVAELRAEPRAALLAWVPQDQLQIRARVHVTVHSGPALDAAWAAMPEAARVNYGGQPPPGLPLARYEDYRETVERARFALLSCEVRGIDLVHLGTPHRRAIYRADDGFAGSWVGP
jgi:hypothetical protein